MASHGTQSVLLLGAGGFIGTHLTKALVRHPSFKVTAVDISKEKLDAIVNDPSLTYVHCDITGPIKQLEDLIKAHDIIVDLVAVANPSVYVSDPISVFQLNFTENLKIVELCVKYDKRIVQFSTCEVYGMTVASVLGKDPMEMPAVFNEDTTPLIIGPIKNHRWIYACSKQLLERVLHAYGLERGLKYTIIRPFNFVGPEIDYLPTEHAGNPRVFSHFMNALLYGTPMKLVDGGRNLRAYTYIDDAVECMVKIMENPGGVCDQQIFNIGKPDNELSIKEMAHLMVELFNENFRQPGDPNPEIVDVSSEEFYGKGYEDCDRRIADIEKARTLLGWDPKTDLRATILKTMEYFVERHRSRSDTAPIKVKAVSAVENGINGHMAVEVEATS